MKYLIPFLFLCVSCVTSADIRALADAQEDLEMKTAQITDDLEQGTITAAQAKEQLSAAKDIYLSSVKDAAEEVEGRSKTWWDNLTDSNSLSEIGVSALLAFLGVNKYRNDKRLARGEPVGTQKA